MNKTDIYFYNAENPVVIKEDHPVAMVHPIVQQQQEENVSDGKSNDDDDDDNNNNVQNVINVLLQIRDIADALINNLTQQ